MAHAGPMKIFQKFKRPIKWKPLFCVQVTCFVLFFSQGRKRAPPESVVDFTYEHASIFKNARKLNNGQVPTVVRLKDPKSSQVLI